MLTISKALSAGQAQTYHSREFTSEEQNYLEPGPTRAQRVARGTGGRMGFEGFRGGIAFCAIE